MAKNVNDLRVKYPYIEPWNKRLGAFGYYIEAELALADADDAPANAIYRGQDGVWLTTDGITNPDARLDLGLPLHDMTCGTCGRTWSSVSTPTPAARCPFEADHEEEPDDVPATHSGELDAVVLLTRDRKILGVRAFRAGQDQSELLDIGMEDPRRPFRAELWHVGEFPADVDGFVNAAERTQGSVSSWHQAPR